MRTMSRRTWVAMDFSSDEFMWQKYLKCRGRKGHVQNIGKPQMRECDGCVATFAPHPLNPTHGLAMWHRRPSQRRQIHPLQLSFERQSPKCKLSFCTIEPNLGVITVPDPRLNKLAELVQPQNVIPTTVEIVDIAGLVKGASKGRGSGTNSLGNIRTTDAILHVLRCFEDDNIVHVDGSIDPIRDKEVIDIELQLKDLETVESRMSKVKKAAQTGDKEAVKQMGFFSRLVEHLEQGKSARGLELEEFEAPLMKEMQLLTSKPILYVCNVDEGSVVDGNAHVERVPSLQKKEQECLCLGLPSRRTSPNLKMQMNGLCS